MPWLEIGPMQQREQFIAAYQHGGYSMTELCTRYGISRKTGYKWLARFAESGRRGLADQSRAPRTCPHRISAEVERRVCAARHAHPHWGPAKLLGWLARRHPEIDWPAPSTAGEVLVRHGLVSPRPRRQPHRHPGSVAPATTAPNDLWTADFKGQFPTQDRVWCYPLTMADQHTRFLLSCRGLASTQGAGVRPWCERVFRTYGLPAAIRTDNGAPFASTGLHGLSTLNVWWMRLGIAHQRIQPGCPQQNGAHERMHRTLKRETARPPRANAVQQQRAFDAFRREYNTERPHEYLGGTTPATHYTPSPRPYPARLPAQEYPGHFLVKRISSGGIFRFHDRLLFLSHALTTHHIGLEETDDGIWSIFFNTVLLAKLDERDYVIRG